MLRTRASLSDRMFLTEHPLNSQGLNNGGQFLFLYFAFQVNWFLYLYFSICLVLLRLLWPYIVGRSDRLAPRVGGWGELWCRLAPRVSTVGVSAASPMVGTAHLSPQLPTIETEKPSSCCADNIQENENFSKSAHNTDVTAFQWRAAED